MELDAFGAVIPDEQRAELEALGWSVGVLPGLDHFGAVAADVVVPRLSGFLDHHVGAR